MYEAWIGNAHLLFRHGNVCVPFPIHLYQLLQLNTRNKKKQHTTVMVSMKNRIMHNILTLFLFKIISAMCAQHMKSE